MNGGRILVVLPTLGERLETLEQTLESVEAQREDVDLTLVMVLPGRAAEAREMARRYAAVLVEDPMKGISHAINLGIEAALDEEYYAWVGDDDLFLPNSLKTLRDLIEQRPDAVVSFGACQYIDSAGRVLRTNTAGRLAQWLLPWGPNLIPHPGSMIRLTSLRQVGLFDEELKYAMDLDLFLKLRRTGKFISTRVPVSAFRWHPASLTVSARRKSGEESEMIKRRHLPRGLRVISPVWSVPMRWAASLAARSLNSAATRR